MGINVKLVDFNKNPIRDVYLAYRTCYSSLDQFEIINKIDNNEITESEMKKFLIRMMKTGHKSPLRFLNLMFIVEGISRSATAQINRHSVGVNILEVSQRYVNLNEIDNFVVPPKIKKTKLYEEWVNHHKNALDLYSKVLEIGIPKEDARYCIPISAQSRETISMNFEALQHFLDVRLCTTAQWEIRSVAGKMLQCVKKEIPFFHQFLGCKCLKQRNGFCDETIKSYKKCPLRHKVPHRSNYIGV